MTDCGLPPLSAHVLVALLVGYHFFAMLFLNVVISPAFFVADDAKGLLTGAVLGLHLNNCWITDSG